MERIATIKKTTEILKEYSIKIKKNFGQNFLIAPTIPERISLNPHLTKNTLVIEVGPGVGALTQFLLERVQKVICYEIDTNLIPALNKLQESYSNLEINNTDFMKVDLLDINTKGFDNVVIVSNLPYYLTSDILLKIMYCDKDFDILAMMQKEVAQRILKAEGKEHNKLTLTAKYFMEVSKVCEVSKNDFFPRPRVDSTVLFFKNKKIKDRIKFMEAIKILYAQRQKTIDNNLKAIISDSKIREDVLNKLGLTKTSRIDELSFTQLIELFHILP